MPASIIQFLFDDGKAIAQMFNSQAEEIKESTGKLKTAMDTLQGGDWIGMGAEKFYGEMEDEILPAMEKLSAAMEEAANVTKQIDQIWTDTDEENSKLIAGVIVDVNVSFG